MACVIVDYLQGADFSKRIQTEGDLGSWKTKPVIKTSKGKGMWGLSQGGDTPYSSKIRITESQAALG